MSYGRGRFGDTPGCSEGLPLSQPPPPLVTWPSPLSSLTPVLRCESRESPTEDPQTPSILPAPRQPACARS